MKLWCSTAVVVFLVVLPGTLPAEETPVFSTQLDMVNLTVSVRDRSGRLVTDLKAEDFVVKDQGTPQHIEVFGRAHDPGQDEILSLDLGLLLDTSNSMLKQLKLSQYAVVRFLESVPRARELVTIFFAEEIRLSRYNSENQQGLFQRIHDAEGGGNTALYDSIAVYLFRVQDSPRRKVLVMFTDGQDSTSSLGLSDVVHLLKASRVTVYAIALNEGLRRGPERFFATSVLRRITSLTGGAVYNPHSARDLGGIYDRILADLSGQYVLGYVPSDTRRDGRYRKLKVQVRRRDLKARHRRGYYSRMD